MDSKSLTKLNKLQKEINTLTTRLNSIDRMSSKLGHWLSISYGNGSDYEVLMCEAQDTEVVLDVIAGLLTRKLGKLEQEFKEL